MNIVSLVGRLTQDLALRDSTNGDKYLFFTVATNEYRNGQEVAQFVPCVAWGPIAENMTRFLKKGSLVGVSGRLTVRSRQENNQFQTIVNVHANRVEFLDSKSSRMDTNQNFGSAESIDSPSWVKGTKSIVDPTPIANPMPTQPAGEVAELDDSILWD